MTARVVTTRALLWAQAMTVSPSLILIRPERANDRALIAHEQRHVQQMREIGTLRFWWNYLTNPAFRLRVEVEAYRVQLDFAPSGLDRMAELLSTRYFLDITKPQARALLLDRAK